VKRSPAHPPHQDEQRGYCELRDVAGYSVVPSAGLLLIAAVLQDGSTPADTTTRARLTVLPVVSYSEVTGLQYGSTVFRSFRLGSDTGTRSSSMAAYAAWTARGHNKAHVQLDLWAPGNDARLRFRVEHMSYPLPYFGIGRDTPDSAEQWYSSGVTTVQAFTERRWRGPVYLHGGVRYVRARVREIEPALDPALTPDPSPYGSVLLSGFFGLVVDSRDHTGAPRAGAYVRVLPSISRQPGASTTLNRITIDARQYRPLTGAHVVALQFQYDGTSGQFPFDLMPMIGADTSMRGYPRGRFRDRHAMTAQAELRSGYWRRVGAVAFAGAGTVAPTSGSLASGAWYPSVGAGLRYVLSPRDRTTVRTDFGIGRGSFGLTVGIGEAF
jgi:hypothetical protein